MFIASPLPTPYLKFFFYKFCLLRNVCGDKSINTIRKFMLPYKFPKEMLLFYVFAVLLNCKINMEINTL